MSSALTAIYSQTFNSILTKLFQQNEIEQINCQSYQDLLKQAQHNQQAPLIFISRELLQSANLPLEKAIDRLKFGAHRDVYVLSSNKDFKDIEQHISAGATDVILTSKVAQIENILKSFRIQLDTQKAERPYQVLLVEDSKILVEMVAAQFQQQAIILHTAASVMAGLEILKSQAIDVILCDIVLEGDITGIELVRQTYQNSKWRDVPIIVTSAFSDNDRLKHFYRLGVRDFIAKPYDIEVLYLKTLSLAKEHRIYQLLIEDRKQIEEIAFTDTATGLRNRTYLKYEYDQWVLDHPNNAKAMLIEVDDYHKIKREYGLSQSEKALAKVADSLRQLAGQFAMLVHLTGEQFILLVANQDEQKIITLAKSIVTAIGQHQVAENSPLSVCIGITEAKPSLKLDDLLKIADGCLFLAKEEGKGQIETTF